MWHFFSRYQGSRVFQKDEELKEEHIFVDCNTWSHQEHMLENLNKETSPMSKVSQWIPPSIARIGLESWMERCRKLPSKCIWYIQYVKDLIFEEKMLKNMYISKTLGKFPCALLSLHSVILLQLLGGVFKYLLFSSLLGEMIEFD